MLLLGGLMFLLMEFSGCVPITENTKNINNITALPGEVSLPCRVSNMNFTVLNWSRSDLLPQYVFMYKDKKPLSENQHPSFKGRVELAAKHMKDGNISVTLKNVTTNDSGTYTCEIIWNRTKLREIISRVNLQVQPGPKAGNDKEAGNSRSRYTLIAVAFLFAFSICLIGFKLLQNNFRILKKIFGLI